MVCWESLDIIGPLCFGKVEIKQYNQDPVFRDKEAVSFDHHLLLVTALEALDSVCLEVNS